jgi:hypothetical protein
MSGVHFLVEYIAESGLFSHGVYTPSAEKCNVEHICFHSVRLLRDMIRPLATLSTATGNEVFGSVLISPALLIPPNKQTNKQVVASEP